MQERRFRNSITLFTFALTILVIWVHSVNLETEGTMLTALTLPAAAGDLERMLLDLEHFVSETLGQTAVPGFFMVSGFLFYRNVGDEAAVPWILGKWKRRVFSLLIPYLVWNFLAYLLYAAAALAGLFLTGKFDAGSAFYTAGAFLLSRSGAQILTPAAAARAILFYTYQPVFWYLYELILLTLLAPVFLLLLRKKKVAAAALVCALFTAVFWQELPFHLVNEDAVFYYFLGAFAGSLFDPEKGKMDFIRNGPVLQTGSLCLLWVLWGLLYAGRTGCHDKISAEFDLVWGLFVTITFRALFPLTVYRCLRTLSERGRRLSALLEREKLPGALGIGFFLYAAHYPLVKLINLLGVSVCRLPAVALFGVYLLLPAICVGILYPISRVMRQRTPRLFNMLCGGRAQDL